MESGLALACKGGKTESLKTSGSSMRCNALLGVPLNGGRLAPLVLFKGELNGRVAGNFSGMPVSTKYICQDMAWVDQMVYKHWIMEIWTPFALMKVNPTYILMDEFCVHMMSICCNEIKDSATEIDHIIGGCTSKLQVMYVGVYKPFTGSIWQEYEKIYSWTC